MKRIMIPALIVLGLLFLFPKERSFARDDSGFNLAALQWKVLRDGAAKTDLGNNLPEVIILRLTNDQYGQYFASEDTAKQYLNTQSIFKRDLINVIFCNATANKGGEGWLVIIPHTPRSTGCIVAWQLPKKGKEK